MKKIYCLIFVFLLFGCKSPDNPNCMNMSRFKVAQVLDSGALAYECKHGECSPFNRWVALEMQLGMDYYDDMIVNVPSDKCAVQDGVYKYQTKDERIKTVPIVDFDYKYEASSEEEVQERIQEKIDTMRLRMENECQNIIENKEDRKKCSCFSDVLLEELVSAREKNDNFKGKEQVIKNIEKKCGKLPKELRETL